MDGVRDANTADSRLADSGPDFADRYRPFALPSPGDDLVNLLHEHAERVPASAVWHCDPPFWLIPRLGEDEPAAVVEDLGPWALEVTRSGSEFALRQAKPEERKKLSFLTVAVEHDLWHAPEIELARRWHYGEHGTESSQVRAVVRKGRALWRSLGAWPWSSCPPGRLPAEWWLDPKVQSDFRAWSVRREAVLHLELSPEVSLCSAKPSTS